MGLCLRRLVLQYPCRGGRVQPESVAAFNRNQWQPSTGIGGRVRPESVATFARNTQHPREVFKPAILSNAAALILAHNHPSGQPQPSQEDRVLTVRLVAAGKLLGISVLDHVIIGDGTSAYFSFADEGLLERS
jgi:RadC-like JAB domain